MGGMEVAACFGTSFCLCSIDGVEPALQYVLG